MLQRVILYNQCIVYKRHIYVMIVRLLIIIMVIYAVYYLLRRVLYGPTTRAGNSHGVRHSKMVKCGYCQVYIAEEEAVGKQGDYYCSTDHKNRAQIEKSK